MNERTIILKLIKGIRKCHLVKVEYDYYSADYKRSEYFNELDDSLLTLVKLHDILTAVGDKAHVEKVDFEEGKIGYMLIER